MGGREGGGREREGGGREREGGGCSNDAEYYP